MKKFFRFFHQPRLSISSMLTSKVFRFTRWGCPAVMRRKINDIIQYKAIFDSSLHCINQCPFKWLFECGSELVRVQTYMIRLVRYSLRHYIIHNFLSVYDLYSNLFRALPLLECFGTSAVKVADRPFRTILDTLNNLTVLILWAPSSNNKIRSFYASSFVS